jgi:hypothetical protein
MEFKQAKFSPLLSQKKLMMIGILVTIGESGREVQTTSRPLL